MPETRLRKSSRGLALGLMAGVLLASSASSLEPGGSVEPEISVRDIEACVASNLPERSGTMEFSVRAWDRSGDAENSRAELLWLRHPDGLSSVLLRLSEPADTRGTSVLVIQNLERDPDLLSLIHI